MIALLLAFLPTDAAQVDTVDVIERNHVFNCHGDATITQWIFWDWDGANHRVVAWRLDKGQTLERRNGGWRVLWHDGDTLRDVRAAHYRETWTQHDVEVWERETWPQERRRGLVNH